MFPVLWLYWFPQQRWRNRCAMSNVPGAASALPASARCRALEILFTKGCRPKATVTRVRCHYASPKSFGGDA